LWLPHTPPSPLGPLITHGALPALCLSSSHCYTVTHTCHLHTCVRLPGVRAMPCLQHLQCLTPPPPRFPPMQPHCELCPCTHTHAHAHTHKVSHIPRTPGCMSKCTTWAATLCMPGAGPAPCTPQAPYFPGLTQRARSLLACPPFHSQWL
jgi:hypothetical protein